MMKILPVLLLALLLLFWFYPIQIAAELKDRELKIYWRPLPLCRARATVFTRKLSFVWPGDKPPQKPPRKSVPRGALDMLTDLPAAVRLRRFRLHISLGGDPVWAAALSGALWGALSTALGWLSFRLAAVPHDMASSLRITLPAEQTRLSESDIELAAEVSFCLGALLRRLLAAWLKNKFIKRGVIYER